jgi:hypothetical protein
MRISKRHVLSICHGELKITSQSLDRIVDTTAETLTNNLLIIFKYCKKLKVGIFRTVFFVYIADGNTSSDCSISIIFAKLFSRKSTTVFWDEAPCSPVEVSEECTTSIFRVKDMLSKKQATNLLSILLA